MSSNDLQNSLAASAFRLDSVVSIADPTGGDATWFRYVISQGPDGENAITGSKSGSLSEVHIQLREMVDRLNERFGKLQGKRRA